MLITKMIKVCTDNLSRLCHSSRSKIVSGRMRIWSVMYGRLLGYGFIAARRLELSDQLRSGHPRVGTLQQDRDVTATHLRNRFQPATVSAGTIPRLRRISPGTVRNHFREHALCARRPTLRPYTVLNLVIFKRLAPC